MKAGEFVVWQVPVIILSTSLFGLSTEYLRAATCIEGGTVIGFPWYFYIQCYAYMPGGPLGLAEFGLAPLLIDVVFWYLVSMALVFVSVVVYRRLRGM